ncbi:MAG: hypothetical protein IKR63_05840 [Alloprevotella sp.]|nr:hypothetical protein [Alloprevotella sp.]
MNQLQCPQCGNPINPSDQLCPTCGQDLTNIFAPKQNLDAGKTMPPSFPQKLGNANTTNTMLFVIIAVLATIILMGGAFWLWNHMQTPKEPQPAAEKQQTPPETVYVQQETKTIVVPAKKTVALYGNKILYGAIGKYSIRMDINISPDGTVEGTYTYLKQGNWLRVYGTYEKGRISLEEFTPKGNNSGNFFGSYNGITFEGTFHNYQHNTTYSFNVTEQ